MLPTKSRYGQGKINSCSRLANATFARSYSDDMLHSRDGWSIKLCGCPESWWWLSCCLWLRMGI